VGKTLQKQVISYNSKGKPDDTNAALKEEGYSPGPEL